MEKKERKKEEKKERKKEEKKERKKAQCCVISLGTRSTLRILKAHWPLLEKKENKNQ